MTNTSTNHHTYYNNQFFGRWTQVYDFEKYFFSPLRKKSVEFANLKTPQKILDVATGTGALAYEFAKSGHDVVGIDLSPKMLLQANKKLSPKLKLRFEQADGTALPFKDNTFDVSTISWGIHDMPCDIGLKVLKEMTRVTKKGGHILIVDYMEPSLHLVAKFTHPLISLYETKNYLPFIKNGIDSYLKKTGLKVTKRGNYLGIWQMLLIKLSDK